MTESLKLHQGPGLNGLFQAAARPKGYALHIPERAPDSLLLKPDTLKLLDILVCKLGDSRGSYRVGLPFEEFLRLAGYAVTDTNKDFVRHRLKESIALLGKLSVDWQEDQYTYHDVRFFSEITYRNSCGYACFSGEMAQYLLNCPIMRLPLSLLNISGKSRHSYLLGRRCLVHNESNKDRKLQTIRVEILLAACPRIPGPASQEMRTPSALERKVILPFTRAMKTLKECGILTWTFQEPVCRDSYEGFSQSIVEFRVRGNTVSALPAEPAAKRVCGPFDSDWFHALQG